MAFDHSKFLMRFVEEAREHCSRLSEGLLNLESTPDNSELVNGLFRSAHTIKGSSRMMKLMGITELAHKMEDILDAVRSRKISCDASVSNTLFIALDALSAMLDEVQAGNKSPEAPEGLCDSLVMLLSEQANAGKKESPEQPQSDVPPQMGLTQSAPPVSSSADKEENLPPAGDSTTISPNKKPVHDVDKAAQSATANAGQSASGSREKQVDYLRIKAEKLDDLIRLMGEIVSEQNRFNKHIERLNEIERMVSKYFNSVAVVLQNASSEKQNLIEAGALLKQKFSDTLRSVCDASLLTDHLVADLQDTSLKMRMQPLSTVFEPLRRTVREMAREHGKEIDFLVEGGDTELDRKIIDRIGDSIIHMIRNSLDHAIETAEERIAAGKPAKGTISLQAYYDNGCVTISLQDNGRGLALDRIREKALARNLVTPDSLAGMTTGEVANLIFLPGFSTSPIITDFSGRGVGMDVVRKSIVDELKGTILIDTSEGRGTTFLLRLPLNLAVFPLYIVSIYGHTCALPATSLVEMLTVSRNEVIDIVNRKAIRLRNQIIPVEKLSAILKLHHDDSGDEGKELLIVIVRDGETKLGLIVSEIIGREEMVVKPLPLHLQNLKLVSGVTIGEKNSIINVLHVPELMRQANELAGTRVQLQSYSADHVANILVVDDSINTREIEKSILEAYGYTVDTAEDGADAFTKTRNTVYDLVITDVEMPRLDGFSLCERLRADERYAHIPLIIVTSREKDEDKKRGIAVGANAYIVKGAFDQSNLIETVRNLI